MAGPKNKKKTKDAKNPTVGEKHQTEHESPDPKRAKKEKQGDDETEDSPALKVESAEKPGEEPEVPRNILEKGIIYFFVRGRVDVDNPTSVDDIARTYLLLRPIDKDARLGEGSLNDASNTRLLALPKKVLPQSGKDRFMIFVENPAASFKTIKETFLAGSEYTTKTAGTRHTPAATPAGEGIYAITMTGRESHLVYMLTLPEKLGEVQKEIGIRDKASFIISTKNPEYKGPPSAHFNQMPEFSKEIMDEFRCLRWLPTRPAHLDYSNAQMLLIGETSGIEKATEKQKDDEKEGKEDPKEALENLEEEDLKRMRHLPGDQSASIYADLEADAKDYPKLKTKFE